MASTPPSERLLGYTDKPEPCRLLDLRPEIRLDIFTYVVCEPIVVELPPGKIVSSSDDFFKIACENIRHHNADHLLLHLDRQIAREAMDVVRARPVTVSCPLTAFYEARRLINVLGRKGLAEPSSLTFEVYQDFDLDSDPLGVHQCEKRWVMATKHEFKETKVVRVPVPAHVLGPHQRQLAAYQVLDTSLRVLDVLCRVAQVVGRMAGASIKQVLESEILREIAKGVLKAIMQAVVDAANARVQQQQQPVPQPSEQPARQTTQPAPRIRQGAQRQLLNRKARQAASASGSEMVEKKREDEDDVSGPGDPFSDLSAVRARTRRR